MGHMCGETVSSRSVEGPRMYYRSGMQGGETGSRFPLQSYQEGNTCLYALCLKDDAAPTTAQLIRVFRQ